MSFKVLGWCPGALRPMMSGDGLVVRVRPRGGRISPAQAAGIAAAARAHGNGLIDLSGRANVQLRGVTEDSHTALIADLTALGLIDTDLRAETRRNVIVTPFADAATDALAESLHAALADAPDLPGKFGFILDCAAAPVMASTSADIRFERSADGGLLLRADGMAQGAPVTSANAAARAIELAHWFAQAGGISNGRGRMAALIAKGKQPQGHLAATTAPAPAMAPPGPGLVANGALVAFEFGQMEAETFARLGALGPLRITPWRMILIEGMAALPDLPGLITDPENPLLRVFACTGAPGCVQAAAPTRPLARALAPLLGPGKVLHVSGCAKGCACPMKTPLTVVATANGYDLVQDGTAMDTPSVKALTAPELAALSELL